MLSELGHVKTETGKLATADQKHDEKIGDLRSNFRTFSVLVYIFWAVLLVILGGVFTKYFLPKILGGP